MQAILLSQKASLYVIYRSLTGYNCFGGIAFIPLLSFAPDARLFLMYPIHEAIVCMSQSLCL